MKFSYLTWSILFLFGCSQVNQKEQTYYQQQKRMRHGIVPVRPNVSEVSVPHQGSKDQTKIGEQIFMRDCARCHGDTGEGNGPEAKNQERPPVNLKLAVREMNHFDFFFSISQMEKSMPGWDHPYTDEERKAIAAYLKTL
ncbi:MAG: c-type cytochrome [Bacteriovoracaceae bacterium]